MTRNIYKLNNILASPIFKLHSWDNGLWPISALQGIHHAGLPPPKHFSKMGTVKASRQVGGSIGFLLTLFFYTVSQFYCHFLKIDNTKKRNCDRKWYQEVCFLFLLVNDWSNSFTFFLQIQMDFIVSICIYLLSTLAE